MRTGSENLLTDSVVPGLEKELGKPRSEWTIGLLWRITPVDTIA